MNADDAAIAALTPDPSASSKSHLTGLPAAKSKRKEDNVGLAAEFAVAGYLTNAGWFAALMPSTSFPGIDIMARKHGFEPVSVQVKATRKVRTFFVIDSRATRDNGAEPDVAAQIYVFAVNTTAGFNGSWTFAVMTRDEVRACMKRDAGGAYVPAAVVREAANHEAWSKMMVVARALT